MKSREMDDELRTLRAAGDLAIFGMVPVGTRT